MRALRNFSGAIDFIDSIPLFVRGIIPAAAVLRIFINFIASWTVTLFFYVFYKAQSRRPDVRMGLNLRRSGQENQMDEDFNAREECGDDVVALDVNTRRPVPAIRNAKASPLRKFTRPKSADPCPRLLSWASGQGVPVAKTDCESPVAAPKTGYRGFRGSSHNRFARTLRHGDLSDDTRHYGPNLPFRWLNRHCRSYTCVSVVAPVVTFVMVFPSAESVEVTTKISFPFCFTIIFRVVASGI